MYPIDHLYRGFRRDPAAIAVEDGSRSLSYADLLRAVEAIATGLQTLFPRPGTRIGICAYNTIEHMLAVLGVYAAGHVWVALNPRSGRPALDAIVESTALAAIIADTDCLDRFTPGNATLILGAGAAAADEALTLDGLCTHFDGARPHRPTHDLTEPQTIKFTGGSTGAPKGVIQSYRCVNTSIACFLHTFGFGPEDINLCAAPLTHGASHYILPIFSLGGRHILIREPKAAILLDAIEAFAVTTSFMPPTMIYNLLNEPSLDRHDYGSLRHLQYGAAAMPEARIRRARAVFNNALEVIYGQTEAPMMITAMTAAEFADERNINSVGRETLLSRVAIRAEDGTLLGPGEQGEIAVAGDLLMNGYLDRPQETRETIVDGWLRTGDVGMLDERGYLFIKDRLRDIVISGGFNIYPSDVEQVLSAHPLVRECVAFGVPDERWGERLEAAVVPKTDAVWDEAVLRAFLRERLGAVQTPKRIHAVEALPRNAVGKVLRREMRERIADSAPSGSPSSGHPAGSN